jgi:ketosteroid isomerase-like protein
MVSAVGRVLLVVGVLALCITQAHAQVQGVPPLEDIKSQAELDKAITALDAALFDTYNRCDLEKFATFFTDDVEFYHDQGGVTLGKVNLTESVRKNICGGDVRRELLPGTLEVHYMKGYGAVEIGVHRFYHPKTNGAAGEAKFVHLWQYVSTGKGEGAWKITRVLSFDHHTAAK